jgi:hypothetical protein
MLRSRAKTIGILLVVALFVLLPLYELADVGEQWPHDGDIVQIIFFLVVLAALSIFCRRSARACLARLRRAWIPRPPVAHSELARSLAPRDCSSLFLVFCDFRI